MVCLVLTGCGFRSAFVAPDGPGDPARDGSVLVPDAQSDAPVAEPTTCQRRWLDGTVTLSAPQKLVNQSAAGVTERDPWISTDQLRLYYAYTPSGGTSDVYLASRASTAVPFGNGDGNRLVDLNSSNADDGRAALTADETTVVLSSNKVQAIEFDILLATREATTADFPTGDTRYLHNVNVSGFQHYDPFLTADGLRLYLAPVPVISPAIQHILVATRPDRGSAFAAATPVPGISDGANADADPAVSLDERILVFTSNRPSGAGGPTRNNLWYATRPDRQHDFGAPTLIPGVNSDNNDGDPMLSADGCALYFASTRASGNDYDLYSAQVAP